MVRKDTGWQPQVGVETYEGFLLWDHDVGPHEVTVADEPEDVSFEDVPAEDLSLDPEE